jgi:hypothetical protein
MELLVCPRSVYLSGHCHSASRLFYVLDEDVYNFVLESYRTIKYEFRNVDLSLTELFPLKWLFKVLRPAQEFFTYMETSPLPVKKI